MLVTTAVFDIAGLKQFGWWFTAFVVLTVYVQVFAIVQYLGPFRRNCADLSSRSPALLRAYKATFYLLTLTAAASATVGLVVIWYVALVRPAALR